MRRIIAALLVSLSVGSLLPTAVVAQQGEMTNEPMPLPPPPGPYISSRSYLDAPNPQRQEGNHMPFTGTMPPPPMRYMSPRQMPQPSQWWYGPMWR